MAVLLCVALIGSAMPVLATGIGAPESESCSHMHHDRNTVSHDLHAGSHAMACTEDSTGHERVHAAGSPWAGCTGGAGCFSPPAIGIHPPLPSPARRTVDIVRWPDLSGGLTAQSIPPDLRPPRSIL